MGGGEGGSSFEFAFEQQNTIDEINTLKKKKRKKIVSIQRNTGCELVHSLTVLLNKTEVDSTIEESTCSSAFALLQLCATSAFYWP